MRTAGIGPASRGLLPGRPTPCRRGPRRSAACLPTSACGRRTTRRDGVDLLVDQQYPELGGTPRSALRAPTGSHRVWATYVRRSLPVRPRRTVGPLPGQTLELSPPRGRHSAHPRGHIRSADQASTSGHHRRRGAEELHTRRGRPHQAELPDSSPTAWAGWRIVMETIRRSVPFVGDRVTRERVGAERSAARGTARRPVLLPRSSRAPCS